MEEEINFLYENSTQDLVDLPFGRKVISNRWLYKIKRNADGEISRYKARFVARRFSKSKGVDYNETYSPVARFDTIRSMIGIAANEKLEMAQFDVQTAFLNGPIENEICMQQPQGFKDGSQHVYKLQKGWYGLKQSSRCWNTRFKEVLFSFGLQESAADPCLFYRLFGCNKLIVVLYVDDGLVLSTKTVCIKELIEKLKLQFKITSEPVGCFLNVLMNRLPDVEKIN